MQVSQEKSRKRKLKAWRDCWSERKERALQAAIKNLETDIEEYIIAA